ncbi:hypothetical protein QTP70_001587 [Hemibagrus guttatus]|uniref:Uncharacterized protein n=1 Tax=Hemibagrus guttatus TaxID=175788 RepID=A0AAE0PRZ1_9TELE|nr:hypothetical protein QTP70_001587 [Hemibagrus guttatus]
MTGKLQQKCSQGDRETGRKVLGVSSGRRKEDKETWWWNEEVQDSVQRKRLARKKWDMDRTEENRQEYKEVQHRVKREVSTAKQKAYDELYTRLDTREGEKDLYRCVIIPSMPAGASVNYTCNMRGRYVNVIIPNVNQYLTLCEVEVYGVPVPVFKKAFLRIKFNSREDLSNPTLRDKVLQKKWGQLISAAAPNTHIPLPCKLASNTVLESLL